MREGITAQIFQGGMVMVRVSEISTYWLEEDSPIIPIHGAWLKDFGFEPGQKVVIYVTKGQIVIKAVDHEE